MKKILLGLLLTMGVAAHALDVAGPSTFNAADNAVTIKATNGQSFIMVLSGITGTAGVQVQGSLNGSDWTTLYVRKVVGTVQNLTATANGTYMGSGGGFRSLRAKALYVASGVATATLSWSDGPAVDDGPGPNKWVHREVTATDATTPFTLITPTAGTRVVIQAIHMYATNNVTTASGGLVPFNIFDGVGNSYTGYYSKGSFFAGSTAATASSGMLELDADGPDMFGWGMASAGPDRVVQGILTKALTGTGTVMIHIGYSEE